MHEFNTFNYFFKIYLIFQTHFIFYQQINKYINNKLGVL